MSVYVDAAAFDEGVGRWSRLLARGLVAWLGAPRDARWLDVGSGTGAVAAAALDLAWPGAVTGVDSSPSFIEHARARVAGAEFLEGDATALPFSAPAFDVTAASLVVAALPDPGGALREMARVTVPGGLVAITAWDADGHLYRDYWDAVHASGVAGAETDPRQALPIRDQRTVHEALGGAGLRDIHTHPLEATATLESFDALWTALTGRMGHTAAHFRSLDAAAQAAVREHVSGRFGPGPVSLSARAWAGRAIR